MPVQLDDGIALIAGLPVVALPGALMRGRQSAAMVGILGLPELVCPDADTWVASPYAPQGRATPVGEGFRFSGRWSYSTGTHHCDWIVLGGIVVAHASVERVLNQRQQAIDKEPKP